MLEAATTDYFLGDMVNKDESSSEMLKQLNTKLWQGYHS